MSSLKAFQGRIFVMNGTRILGLPAGINHFGFSLANCAIGMSFLILDTNKNQSTMSKGQDAKKETKKPATKTLKEKRAEKKAKKANKG